MTDTSKQVIGSIVRHLVTAAGGYLVAKGLVSNGAVSAAIDPTTTIVSGAVLYAVGQIASLIQKRFKK